MEDSRLLFGRMATIFIIKIYLSLLFKAREDCQLSVRKEQEHCRNRCKHKERGSRISRYTFDVHFRANHFRETVTQATMKTGLNAAHKDLDAPSSFLFQPAI